MKWNDLLKRKKICLYAGNIYPRPVDQSHLVGLSLDRDDEQHILHDVTQPMPIPDCSIDNYQSEDVFEHIEYEKLPAVIDEIYRVLKPCGLLRLSMPDYRCDILAERSEWENGKIVFDPGGGTTCPHLWFPVFETVEKLLINSWGKGRIEFLHYYDENGFGVLRDIDYSLGYIKRTPDHDQRVQDPRRPMSLVVDCYKYEA